MEKVVFYEDRCIGCGACCSIAQENFTWSDEGKASMINDNVTEEAIDASNSCPTRAIAIEKDECDCKECNCNDNCDCIDDCCCEECNSTEENCTCKDECNCTDDCHCGCKN